MQVRINFPVTLLYIFGFNRLFKKEKMRKSKEGEEIDDVKMKEREIPRKTPTTWRERSCFGHKPSQRATPYIFIFSRFFRNLVNARFDSTRRFSRVGCIKV